MSFCDHDVCVVTCTFIRQLFIRYFLQNLFIFAGILKKKLIFMFNTISDETRIIFFLFNFVYKNIRNFFLSRVEIIFLKAVAKFPHPTN